MKNLVKYLFFLTLPIVIILVVVQSTIYDFELIGKQQENLGIYDQLEKSYVTKQTNNLLLYFQSKESLDQSFYTEREIKHLQDVKKILEMISVISIIFYALLFTTAVQIYVKDRLEQLLKIIIKSLSIAVGLYLLLLAVSQLFFDQLFLLFHQVSFKNDLWLLDPATENLVVIFPTEFFLDMAEFILVKTLIITIFTLGFSFSLKKVMGKKQKI